MGLGLREEGQRATGPRKTEIEVLNPKSLNSEPLEP